MARTACSIGHERYGRKGVSIYVRWPAEPSWVRFKLVACRDHVVDFFGPIFSEFASREALLEDPGTCFNCNTPLVEAEFVIFYTVYWPSDVRKDIEAWFCGACGSKHKAYLETAGTPLVNRDPLEYARRPEDPPPWGWARPAPA